eukprot:scaffold533_cov369-Prasinococcus_capsulatus_cf.AAC.19
MVHHFRHLVDHTSAKGAFLSAFARAAQAKRPEEGDGDERPNEDQEPLDSAAAPGCEDDDAGDVNAAAGMYYEEGTLELEETATPTPSSPAATAGATPTTLALKRQAGSQAVSSGKAAKRTKHSPAASRGGAGSGGKATPKSKRRPAKLPNQKGAAQRSITSFFSVRKLAPQGTIPPSLPAHDHEDVEDVRKDPAEEQHLPAGDDGAAAAAAATIATTTASTPVSSSKAEWWRASKRHKDEARPSQPVSCSVTEYDPTGGACWTKARGQTTTRCLQVSPRGCSALVTCPLVHGHA